MQRSGLPTSQCDKKTSLREIPLQLCGRQGTEKAPGYRIFLQDLKRFLMNRDEDQKRPRFPFVVDQETDDILPKL